ncbi:hypothetical protein GGX14DRAFT_405871 [Mycena pura]|uniref:Uncharacterized protein n=1 Tax=Mycena pura TaxID=153505 RepID=A0AAD6Y5Z5_9AGAR|nr:hypothetical protein GGX14DRAFT_405871 [Mycena pura]
MFTIYQTHIWAMVYSYIEMVYYEELAGPSTSHRGCGVQGLSFLIDGLVSALLAVHITESSLQQGVEGVYYDSTYWGSDTSLTLRRDPPPCIRISRERCGVMHQAELCPSHQRHWQG